MTQRIIPIISQSFIADEAFAERPDWPAIFGNDRPLALEIGCGTGHFIVARAQQQPQTNFIAIDIYNKGCLKTCKKVDRHGLENVRVIRMEARYLLEHGLAFESLAAVYINCPDPWPKKRHRRRRLVNRDFLAVLRHYLAPGGDLYFSTDFVDYAEQVAALLDDLPGYLNRLRAPWQHELPGYPRSKYMERFLDEGKPIHYLHHCRDARLRRGELPRPDFERGFRVDWQKAENG